MKFDFVIGNPPYQDETLGDNKGYAPPVYHKFLDSAYEIADKVEVIHPGRFLFNAGSTPKQWNQKMLNDPHIKVLYFTAKSGEVFPNTLITGGVAITYRDAGKTFGAIGTFTAYPELNAIHRKVTNTKNFSPLSNIAFTAYSYRFSDAMHKDFPNAVEQLSKGHAYDMKSNVFEKLPFIFLSEKPDDDAIYIQILGRENNDRAYKFIKVNYVNDVPNLKKHKIILGRANGASGTRSDEAARLITKPLVAAPYVGHTESFLSIGSFDTEAEALALQKYIQGKFSRVLLGVLKTTQDVTPEKFAYVPMQNFTSASDIDWSQSVSGIDKQLYKKYGLTEAEIAFIEAHVKELE